jgi:hypothetical protein
MEIDELTKYYIWNWSTCTLQQHKEAKRVLMPEDNPDDIGFYVISYPCKDAYDRLFIYWCEIEVWDLKTSHWICDIHLYKDSSTAWYTFEYDA